MEKKTLGNGWFFAISNFAIIYTLLCEKRQNPLKFKGKPFVIFVNMKIPENLNENTPPKDFPLKSKGKM